MSKLILLGYKDPACKLYTSPLKPLGRLVVGVGVVFIGYGLLTFYLPSGSAFAISGGMSLLSCVGITTIKLEKKIKNKLRFTLWRALN